jgi:hypothetical protein
VLLLLLLFSFNFLLSQKSMQKYERGAFLRNESNVNELIALLTRISSSGSLNGRIRFEMRRGPDLELSTCLKQTKNKRTTTNNNTILMFSFKGGLLLE